MNRKKSMTGLALSGGGIRGAAHLGVLKALRKSGIYPDVISGTSAGSIAGAIFAAGVDIDRFVDLLMDHIGLGLLDPAFPAGYILLFMYYIWAHKSLLHWAFPDGIIKGDKLERFFDDILEHKYFDDLDIPFFAISVDINTGETVVFCSKKYIPNVKMENTVFITDAKVAEGIRASISLPGIFVPKKIKGRRLVDGGIKNNIPLDILYYNGVKKTLAVDLRISKDRIKADNIFEILFASFDIIWCELSNCIRERFPAYFIYPEISGIGYKDYKKIPELANYGEKITLEKLPEIRDYLEIK